MPELPEVETIARKLRKIVIGKRITGVSLSGLSLRRPVPRSLAVALRERTIRRILRRGKYIVVELHPRMYCLVHLGMSGRLLYHPAPFRRTKHTHAIVRFSDASELEYRDPRRFGLLDVFEVSHPDDIPELRCLGIDPLSSKFDGTCLQSLLSQSRRELKAFLLDQKKVAGLGNIYVCEALYRAGLHPERHCNTLSSREAMELAGAIQHILRRAVRYGGTSFSDFVDLEGNRGKNQRYLDVFQKDGNACARCGNTVLRMRQDNRSTYFCACCQK